MSQIPLKLRKQMLLMRAAVEREELAQRVVDVRAAASISAIVRNAMPGDRSRSLASRAFEMMRRHPVAMSAASIVAAQFKFPILKAATKWGGLATAGYKLWNLWVDNRPEARRRVGKSAVVQGRRRPPL